MSADVLAFPSSQASARPNPPVVASAQIIQFPDPSNSLTGRDIDVLLSLVFHAGAEWHCETERDESWQLTAVIGSRDPVRRGYAAYLIYRRSGKLHLIDARMSARWRRLGVFDDAMALAGTLNALLRAAA